MKSELLKYLDSEEGQKSLQEYADKLNAEEMRTEARNVRIGHYLKALSGKNFKALLDRIVAENGDSQKDYWYNQSIVPMPTQKAQLLFDYLFSEQSEAKRLGKKEFSMYETGFNDMMVKYRGYIFHMFFGQGETAYQIVKIKDHKLIMAY